MGQARIKEDSQRRWWGFIWSGWEGDGAILKITYILQGRSQWKKRMRDDELCFRQNEFLNAPNPYKYGMERGESSL